MRTVVFEINFISFFFHFFCKFLSIHYIRPLCHADQQPREMSVQATGTSSKNATYKLDAELELAEVKDALAKFR